MELKPGDVVRVKKPLDTSEHLGWASGTTKSMQKAHCTLRSSEQSRWSRFSTS